MTVTSGMSYTELAEELSRAGFALSNMASIPDISIAGACATGPTVQAMLNVFSPPPSPR